MSDDSLILTLELDADSFAWLNGLRQQHFPPERNVLSAHLTLFHKLDQTRVESMKAVLRQDLSPLLLTFSGLRSLGGGVAVVVESPELLALRARLAAAAAGHLTPQDRQGFRPHVTIQNKVTAADARNLLTTLEQDFVPRIGQGISLQVWRYLGGPWALHERLKLV